MEFGLYCKCIAGIQCGAGVGLHIVHSGSVRPNLDAATGTALGKGDYKIPSCDH